jgi:hypothetical protein
MIPVKRMPERRSLRIALQVLGALIIFAAGLSMNGRLTLTRDKLLAEGYSLSEEQVFRTYLAAQSIHGTAAQHEEALRNYIAMLKRQEAHPTELFSAHVAATHEMLANLRLSKLSQARGDANDVQGYLAAAQSLCREKVKWKECTPEDMEDMGKRLSDMSKANFTE